MNELISIIIPVYNCEKYLKECIDSIIAQTYDNLEIVLIDDGSKDKSGEICDDYEKRYLNAPIKLSTDTDTVVKRNIKVMHKQNEGACYARRDGAKIATSEYIMFVDGDDWIDANMVEVLARLFFDNVADVVTSGFDEGGDNKTFDSFEPGIYEKESLDKLRNKIIYDIDSNRIGMLMTVCGRIFKKSQILPSLSRLPSNIRLWEDLAYCYIPFFYAERVVITHNAFYHYRSNAESTSKGHIEREYEQMAYSFSVARENYAGYGTLARQSISLVETKLFNRYIWARMGQLKTDREEVKRELVAISEDERFIEPVKASIHMLNSKWEKMLLCDLVDKNCKKVILDYYRYQIIKCFFSSRLYKVFQKSYIYYLLKRMWRMLRDCN